MNAMVVCDASVALAWLNDEPRPPWADDLMTGRIGPRVVVPSLFWLEVGNLLGRDRTISSEQALEGYLRVESLGLDTVGSDRALRLRALHLAREHRLSMYDALYLGLADSLDCQLASLDAELSEAAASMERAYPDRSPTRISEGAARYEDPGPPDPFSLQVIGAHLAELRTRYP